MDDKQVIVVEERFDSYKDLFNAILYNKNPYLWTYVFRGLGSEDYELVPSVLRIDNYQEFWLWFSDIPTIRKNGTENQQLNLEINLLHEFYLLSNRNGLPLPTCNLFDKTPQIPGLEHLLLNPNVSKWIPPELYDLASLAQHYRVPTRLLDWSFDFMTALFFAVMDGLKNYHEDNNIVVWALSNRLEVLGYKLPLKYIVPHYSDNPNLRAQAGILTLWETALKKNFHGTEPLIITPLDKSMAEYFEMNPKRSSLPIFYKFIIPHHQLKFIAKVLDNLGYNEAKIFPGYEGVVSCMQNRKYRASHPPLKWD